MKTEVTDIPEDVTPVVEPDQEGTQPAQEDKVDVEAIRRELESATSQLAEITKAHKTLQKTHEKAVEEGRNTSQIAQALADLKSQFEDLELNQAVLLDGLSQSKTSEYDLTSNAPSQTAQENLRAKREAKVKENERLEAESKSFDAQVRSFNKAMSDAGLSIDDPEVHDALIKGAGNPIESLARIPGYIRKLDAEKLAKEATVREEERVRKAREDAESTGALDNLGGPSSVTGGKGIPTKRSELGPWVANLSSEEYKKLKPDIEKMMAEGKIK